MTVIHAPSHIAPTVTEPKPWAAPATEQDAIDAIVVAQKANGDPIDPAGAKRFVRSLMALGLFKPA